MDVIDFDKEGYQIINKAREQYLRACISQIPFRFYDQKKG
jgi:hypothetical protein